MEVTTRPLCLSNPDLSSDATRIGSSGRVRWAVPLRDTGHVRSVFVFTNAAADVLNALLPVDETEADRVVQMVTIEDPPEWTDGWDDPHRLHQITKRFGHLPKRLVIVDISGKVEGRREALDVVDAIRRLGTTAVFDDWSTSPWSDEELERGQTDSGRHFLSPT